MTTCINALMTHQITFYYHLCILMNTRTSICSIRMKRINTHSDKYCATPSTALLSLAVAAGVRAGDVVVAAGDSAVRSRDEFRIALSLIAQRAGPVVLRVRSAAADRKERTVTLL
jgi:hypothetical protein